MARKTNTTNPFGDASKQSKSAAVKRDRFVRVAEQRTQRVLDDLVSLSKCAAKESYDYSAADVEKILAAIEQGVQLVRATFAGEKRFSLSDTNKGSFLEEGEKWGFHGSVSFDPTASQQPPAEPIDARAADFTLIDIDGHICLFTIDRLDRDTIPADLYCYELRDDPCNDVLSEVSPSVQHNYWGTIICKDTFEMVNSTTGYCPESEEKYTDEHLALEEFQQMSPDELACFFPAPTVEQVKFPEVTLKATNIMWDVDCDSDGEHLPTEVVIPAGMTDEEEISDYLSDLTGFCHEGFRLVEVPQERGRESKLSLDDQIQSASGRTETDRGPGATLEAAPKHER